MTTIQVQDWQPMPTKNLVEGKPVEKGTSPSRVRLDLPTTVGITGEDLIGLTWMLLEDDYT